MAKSTSLTRILRQAESIRVRREQRRQKPTPGESASSPPPRPLGGVRMWFINYNTPIFFLGAPALFLGLLGAIGLSSGDEKSRVVGLGCGALSLAMLAYLLIHCLRTLPLALRAWRYVPDFPVRGLEALPGVYDRAFWRDDAELWIDCTLTVHLKQPDPAATQAFSAALDILVEQANGSFYGADGCDERRDWTRTGLQALGSVDGRVGFSLKVFLCRELATVAHHFPAALEAVEIRSGRSFSVRRLGYSGDGPAA